MPLERSSSKPAFKRNVSTLMKEVGHSPHVNSRAQALAVAYSIQRRNRGRDAGGSVNDPVHAVINALNAGVGSGGQATSAMGPGPMNTSPPSPSTTGIAPNTIPTPPPIGSLATTSPYSVPRDSSMIVNSLRGNPSSQGLNLTGGAMPPNSIPQSTTTTSLTGTNLGIGPTPSPDVRPIGSNPAQVDGGGLSSWNVKNGGAIPDLAFGGMGIVHTPKMTVPWQEKQEARNLTKGPILSNVPGRTDAHKTHVPSGSYVIPADIVSGRGQGNTIAGAHALQRLFKMGPYGAGMPALMRGHGMPRVGNIKAAKMAEGGATDPNIGQPVRVNLAGGEIVVPPENLMEVVHPDLKHAHSIMDAWVLHERKNLRNTLAKLPGPVVD